MDSGGIKRYHPGLTKEIFGDDYDAELGFTTAVMHLRKLLAEEYLVVDPGPRVPESLERRRTCAELHPGFCQMQDTALWPAVSRVCKNINTVMSNLSRWDVIGKVLRLSTIEAATGDTLMMEGVIKECRYARPVMQMLAPLDEDNNMGMLGNRLRYDYSYSFVCEVAKAFCNNDAGAVARGELAFIICQVLSIVYSPERRSLRKDVHFATVPAGALDVSAGAKEFLSGKPFRVWPEEVAIQRHARTSSVAQDLKTEDPILKALSEARCWKSAVGHEMRNLMKKLTGHAMRGKTPGRKRKPKSAPDAGDGGGGGPDGGGGADGEHEEDAVPDDAGMSDEAGSDLCESDAWNEWEQDEEELKRRHRLRDRLRARGNAARDMAAGGASAGEAGAGEAAVGEAAVGEAAAGEAAAGEAARGDRAVHRQARDAILWGPFHFQPIHAGKSVTPTKMCAWCCRHPHHLSCKTALNITTTTRGLRLINSPPR